MTTISNTALISTRIIDTVENIDHVGASPEYILRLIPMFENRDADIAEISSIIEKEPAMAAMVLRLANSAYFSRGTAIGTLPQAIVHLGLNIVKKMVIAFEMIDLCRDQNRDLRIFENDLLKSSIAGAAIAGDLAVRNGLKERDEVYLCGLLRDFGVLILKQHLPDIFNRIYSLSLESKLPFSVACDKICGFNHRYISFLLFSRWNLPSNMLSIFEQGISRYGVWVIIDKIIDYTDYIMKQHGYGQWDPYAIPSLRGAEIFSLDEDAYGKSVEPILREVDDFLLMLSDPRSGIKAA
jgi:HD-like signal output (HDOD) protein